jgi:hypothetical protein
MPYSGSKNPAQSGQLALGFVRFGLKMIASSDRVLSGTVSALFFFTQKVRGSQPWT